MAMREVLTRLEAEWAAQGAPVLEHLAPGITDEEIDATLPAGVVLGEVDRELFRWHNGDLGDDLGSRFKSDFGFGWRFAPLAELAQDYTDEWGQLRQMVAEANDEPLSWFPGWFPIFLGQNDLRLLTKTNPGIPCVAAVRGTEPWGENDLSIFRHYSTLTLLETWSAFLGSRHIEWDATGNKWQVHMEWDTYNSALRH